MKETRSLLITLGHNSSAIYVDGLNVIGYEQERLSGIKADSQFPSDAINEIIKNVGLKQIKDCNILISHWFDSTKQTYLFSPTKYMTAKDHENLLEISNKIIYTGTAFTHHDAHAFSAMNFFNYYNGWLEVKHEPVYTIVADGFGTNQEVVSIYMSADKGKEPKLIHRVFGYENSLGLMYQYATSFCGMKENQDEYKFLGYESHIAQFFSLQQIAAIEKTAFATANKLLANSEETKPIDLIDGYINTNILKQVKKSWHNAFEKVVDQALAEGIQVECEDYDFVKRVIIGYFVQTIIEKYFTELTKSYNMKNVVCAGGCFYNVKLNNAILNSIDGVFSVIPLAGDQGAAIGMYNAIMKEEFPFRTLAIGKRKLYNIEKLIPKGSTYVKLTEHNERDIAFEIASLISNGKIVNLIYDDMEFGPRALCNTSTLMLPTAENVANNNHMNNRNEVMPCAPIVLEGMMDELFNKDEFNRVIGSDLFMICTHTYTKFFSEQYAGVMHAKPLNGYTECVEFTGRPQIVRNGSFMSEVLYFVNKICDAKCLVNTSFNIHGRPIAFDTTEIIQNFQYQCEHAKPGKEPILYIVDINRDGE